MRPYANAFLKCLVAIALGAVATASASVARADDAVVARPPARVDEDVAPRLAGRADERTASPRKVAGEWYGAQIALVDAATIVAGLTTRRWEVFVVGYAAGGPIVHWAHGEVGNGLGSLALRVGAPTILGWTGYAVDSANCKGGDWSFCGLGGEVLGVLGGYVLAEVVDIAVLARERPDAAAAPKPSRTSLRVSPVVAPARGGGSMGVVGVF